MLTKLQRITFLVIIVDMLALVAYDVWAVMQPDGGKPATISWLITWTAQQWWGSSVILAVGILLGHFFAQDGKVTLDGKFEK